MPWSWSYRTCELLDMDAGNHTQLLHKASVFLTTKPNLHPLFSEGHQLLTQLEVAGSSLAL